LERELEDCKTALEVVFRIFGGARCFSFVPYDSIAIAYSVSNIEGPPKESSWHDELVEQP